MEIYLVGGAVRDKLLGLPIKERDWVVVGATISDMLQKGYQQVGKDFPVFLHPKTHEEYALARMERKTHPGYTGFHFDASPQVTLEEDLKRRDLTINAIAETEQGDLIDPYHGQEDLKAKKLRHVSSAFTEDPVRILRVGRFLARYSRLGFTVAEETLALMRLMVASGEVNALVAERVWKELERALAENNPEQFFILLKQCGALAILFPHLEDPEKENAAILALIAACQLTELKEVRFAVLFYPLYTQEKETKTSVTRLCKRYRAPLAYQNLAILTTLHYHNALLAPQLPSESLLHLFNALDIYRREDRFQHFLIACQAIAQANKQPFNVDWLKNAAAIVKQVSVQPFLDKGLTGQQLAFALHTERLNQLNKWLDKKNT